ncbi:hypothetical protein LINPERPRIM_LOCUS38632, partial [Linum perenne]
MEHRLIRKFGRPHHSRLHNKMDWVKEIESHCSYCKQDGYNRRTCTWSQPTEIP